MIKITTNISKVVGLNIQKLQKLADTDQMVRTCATSVLGLMKIRIHQDGLDANNEQIGIYSPGYMKLRTGDYGNSARISRGKNKGSLKNAGVFTKGKNKGAVRPAYNRSGDTKVVASLTREMENDEKVIAVRTNVYGIGFTNKLNFDKSQWVEETYHKEGKIFAVSANESQAITDIVKQFTSNALSQ